MTMAPKGTNGKRGPTAPKAKLQGRPPLKAKSPFLTVKDAARAFMVPEATMSSWCQPRWESSWNPVPVAGHLHDGTPVFHSADIDYRARHRHVEDDRMATVDRPNDIGGRPGPGRPPLPPEQRKPSKGPTGRPVGRPRKHSLPDDSKT